jgi:hypothetical protein
MKLDLLVGSGGVLSHAPRRAQSMLMMIDAFLVEGVTELAVDSIFMMPHLGVLSTIHPGAATEVFEKDCLVRLGTCVAHRRRGPAPGRLLTAELRLPDGASIAARRWPPARSSAPCRWPSAPGTPRRRLTPAKGVDVGAGPGEPPRAGRCAAARSAWCSTPAAGGRSRSSAIRPPDGPRRWRSTRRDSERVFRKDPPTRRGAPPETRDPSRRTSHPRTR